jgi:hypothetical protein
MKQIISKFIATVYEKNYAEADSLLQQIINEKVKNKVKKVIKGDDEETKEKKKDVKPLAKKKNSTKMTPKKAK